MPKFNPKKLVPMFAAFAIGSLIEDRVESRKTGHYPRIPTLVAIALASIASVYAKAFVEQKLGLTDD